MAPAQSCRLPPLLRVLRGRRADRLDCWLKCCEDQMGPTYEARRLTILLLLLQCHNGIQKGLLKQKALLGYNKMKFSKWKQLQQKNGSYQ